MPGFHRGATTGAVLLAASLAMPVAATPRLQASESACRDGDVAAALDDGSLQLRLLPQRNYVGWLEESGVDVRVGVDADRETWIDSGPSRYAREPLRFRSASDGVTELPLQVSATASGDTALALQLQCQNALPQSAQRHWQRLWRFVQARSEYQQGAGGATIMRLGWHALDLLSAEQTPAADRQWLLQQVAGLLRGHGHHREAGQWFALAERAAADDPRRAALAALGAAQSAFSSGDDAAARLRDVRARLHALGLSYPSAVAAHDHCLALRVGGEIARAADCLQSVAAEFAAIGESDQHSNALRNRATALLMLGRYREAEADLAQAMRALGTRDDPRSSRQLSLAAQVQAQLRTWAGDFEQALALLYEALLEREAVGSDADVAHLRRLLGSTYALAGEPERAGVHYRMAIDYYAQRQLGARAASVRLQLADARLAQGQAAEAEALWRQARSELRPDSAIAPWSEATLRLAHLALQAGRNTEAAALLAETEQVGVELPWKWQAERAMLHWRLQRDSAHVASLQTLRQRAAHGGHILLLLELDATLMEAALAAGDVDDAIAIADGAVATGLQAA
ncbi:MAG TPA: hypothetical protein VFY12_09035, partial [Arenimonas sp.]|nr:hypothetical protein [Arenimonas sp.]